MARRVISPSAIRNLCPCMSKTGPMTNHLAARCAPFYLLHFVCVMVSVTAHILIDLDDDYLKINSGK